MLSEFMLRRLQGRFAEGMAESRIMSDSDRPKFSLITSTIGRPEALRELLHSLVEQTCGDFEMIVVDQSRGEAIRGVVDEFRNRITIVHVPMNERGLSRGRNAGFHHAAGEIVGFPDDDCTFPAEYLAEIAARFAAHPEYGGFTTRVGEVARFDSRSGPIDKENIFFRMCESGMFVRRDLLGDVRFDENIGLGAGTLWGADEGPDFILRAMDRGVRFYYCHDLEAWHPNPTEVYDEKSFQRAYSYACGRGYFLRRHGYRRSFCAWRMFRTFLGASLMFLTGRFARGRFYWNSFLGQMHGYFRPGPQSLQVST